MPPFLPRKRLASTPPPHSINTPAKKPRLADVLDAEARNIPSLSGSKRFTLNESDSDSSLTEVDSDGFEDVPGPSKQSAVIQRPEEDDDDEDIEWEDAAPEKANDEPAQLPSIGDIQLTFRKDDEPVDYGTSADASKGKKGPSKREKQVRIQTHCMHVQCLLYHNAIRNRWTCDKTLQNTLVKQLPTQIKLEVDKWRASSGLPPAQEAEMKTGLIARGKRKGKAKANIDRNQRDWGNPSQRLEIGKADLSRGDPLIHLMKVLSAYWKKRFAITAPGLRKRGYGTKLALKQEIGSYRNEDHDPEKHGEKIKDLEEFRALADRCEGSRDVGAQLFTALLRGLGIECRLVASLQPSGYGWTKAEQMNAKKALGKKAVVDSSSESSDDDQDIPAPIRKKTKAKTKSGKNLTRRSTLGGKGTPIDLDSPTSADPEPSDDESVIDVTLPMPKQKPAKYDRDLAFPIYWSEAISPITQTVLPVSPLVLPLPVASTPEVLSTFEPRGVKAEKGKQVMAYVVAYSSDGSAKDVTVRYLRKRMWPGKTKGFRIPIHKIPIYNKHGKVTKYEDYDWFKRAMTSYVRTDAMRSAVDDIEESSDLVPAEPEKRNKEEEGDTLQSLKSSADFVLERFLRREEALRSNATPVRMFVSGKGDSTKQEPVYNRSDVERCLTAESWHKEGRRPKEGENPMKMVPVRAVTLTRKREAEEHERQTGEKQMQGLYCWDQTEYIIPPPIKNGVIPKNSYGNMDCFVPSMIPKGAVHIPLRGTVRICKKLEIDFAEAVTGFEFGNKRAVPVCTGVVVATENEERVREAREKYNAEQKAKEEGKMEKLCLDLWRKMIMGLRIRERVNEDYADDYSEAPQVQKRGTVDEPIDVDADEPGGFITALDEEIGGGFLLPHEDDEPVGSELVIEHHEPAPRRKRTSRDNETAEYPTPSSMPPSKATHHRPKTSTLPESTDSSELSDLSSDLDFEHDNHDHVPDDSSYPTRVKRNPPGRSVSRQDFQVEIPGKGSLTKNSTQLDRADSSETEAFSQENTDQSQSSSDESSNAKKDEPYRPGNTANSTHRQDKSTNTAPATRRRRRPSSSAKAPATATPQRRGPRRASTLVTSPYFNA